MSITGDGRSGITQENTLHAATDFQGTARTLFTNGDKFRQFDIVFTNPPFGSKIKVLKREAAHFALGHVWRQDGDGGYVQTMRAKNTDPQVLFVERCLQMLKKGGYLSIVLPETFFHAPSYRHILRFALDRNNVKAVIDLPHNTFRPHNNAKTCLLILQKGVPQQPQILMAVAEEMGHDHQGRPMFRFDTNRGFLSSKIWDDLALIRSELSNPYSNANRLTFMVNTRDINGDVYVPRYYWPQLQKSFTQLDNVRFVSLQQLQDEGIIETFSGHGSPGSEYKGQGPIPYIRVSDIVNWELYRNPTASVPRHVYEKIADKGVKLEQGDILFVQRGSYRIGSVAMASPFDKDVLLTKEFVIIRVLQPENDYGIDPYYLLYLLSHQRTQDQIKQKVFIDTTLPNIGNRWRELALPVSLDLDARASVRERVKSAIESKWKALVTLNDLRSEFGEITT